MKWIFLAGLMVLTPMLSIWLRNHKSQPSPCGLFPWLAALPGSPLQHRGFALHMVHLAGDCEGHRCLSGRCSRNRDDRRGRSHANSAQDQARSGFLSVRVGRFDVGRRNQSSFGLLLMDARPVRPDLLRDRARIRCQQGRAHWVDDRPDCGAFDPGGGCTSTKTGWRHPGRWLVRPPEPARYGFAFRHLSGFRGVSWADIISGERSFALELRS